MISWLSAHYGDVIVLFVLALAVGSVIFHMIRSRKKGRGCGCTSCKGCAMAGSCHME